MIQVSWGDPHHSPEMGPEILSYRPIAAIIHCVARKHGFTAEQLKGRQRNKDVCLARHEAMFLAATETPCTYPQIGRVFGGRDHTTIIHGVEAHRQRMESP